MPRKIPLIVMRSWLEKYEQGESVASIAKGASRDVRTITHGIEQARHDSEARTARSEMLRDALQKHQGDLAELIESLQSAVTVLPPLNFVMPFGDMTPRRINMPRANAEREGSNEWTVTLDIEGSTKWELFQEHMKRDSIWKALAQWKRAVAAHLEARLALGRKVVTTLREKTGLNVIESSKEVGDSYLYPVGIQATFAHTINWALGISSKAGVRELMASGPNLVFGDGRTPILATGGSVDDYKEKMLAVFDELQQPDVTNQFLATYRAIEEITQKAGKAIEELALMRLVPGQCRVCRRLGL